MRDGATFITRSDDVIEALHHLLGRDQPNPPPIGLAQAGTAGLHGAEPDEDERTRIMDLLGPTPAAVDEIVRQSGGDARAVQLVLLELEIAGRLERRPGGAVSLRQPELWL